MYINTRQNIGTYLLSYTLARTIIFINNWVIRKNSVLNQRAKTMLYELCKL